MGYTGITILSVSVHTVSCRTWTTYSNKKMPTGVGDSWALTMWLMDESEWYVIQPYAPTKARSLKSFMAYQPCGTALLKNWETMIQFATGRQTDAYGLRSGVGFGGRWVQGPTVKNA